MKIDMKNINALKDAKNSLAQEFSSAMNSFDTMMETEVKKMVKQIIGNTTIVPVTMYQHPIIEEWFVNDAGTIFEKIGNDFIPVKVYDHDMGKNGKLYDQVHLPKVYWPLYGNRNVILVHKVTYEAYYNNTVEQKDGTIRHIECANDHRKTNLRFMPNKRSKLKV